jgi:hypothetical protein
MKKDSGVIAYTPFPFGVTVTMADCPWPISGIHGVTETVNPSTGSFVFASVMMISPDIWSSTGGCDDVHTATLSAPLWLMLLASAVPVVQPSTSATLGLEQPARGSTTRIRGHGEMRTAGVLATARGFGKRGRRDFTYRAASVPRSLCSLVACFTLLGAGEHVARAQTGSAPAGAAQANTYSAYERQAVTAALKQYRATVDPSPEGKTLEAIDIVTLDVFEPRDPVPNVFDIFHTTSKRYVIAREVLLAEGEGYQQSLVDDSVRNLRTLPQLSLVLAIPTKGSAPDRVRLLVITKDVWSLRPNWDFQLANGGIFNLSAQPAETNLAGTQTVANLNFILNPAQVVLGAEYTNYRVAGTRIVVQPNANIVLSRETGSPEGSYGGLITGQPLFSPRAEWAWDASINWSNFVFRRFDNATTAFYTDPATKVSIPYAFLGQLYDAQATLTRSFGWSTKHDFALGFSVAKSDYSAVAPGLTEEGGGLLNPPPGLTQRTIADFTAAAIPVSNDRVGPFLQYHTYAKSYVHLLDFETLGLQEDFRLGHEAFVNVYPVTRALGSSSDFLGVDASLLYTWKMGDGLARVAAESITEAESDSLPNASIQPSVHVVSPTALIGRFVFDAQLLYRYRNELNQISFLGGDTRLRGYPTEEFAGKDMVNMNLEFRTRSIDVLTAQMGLVGFYDAGDAFNGFSQLHPYDSVGVGGRILFPQLDRLVFRVDVGFPLGDGARIPGMPPASVFIALSQAFGVPAIGPGGGPMSPQLSGSPTTALSPPP